MSKGGDAFFGPTCTGTTASPSHANRLSPKSGYEVLGHFTLPDEVWWDDFYTPLEARLKELRLKYANDSEALAILDQLVTEPEMFRQQSPDYEYDFFAAKWID